MPGNNKSQFRPDFHSVARVEADRAMVGRVEARVGHWTIPGPQERRNRIVLDAVGPTEAEDNRELPPLFQKIRQTDIARWVAVKTRKLPQDRSKPHYWFTGVLKAPPSGGMIQRLHFDATLNVNRFIQAQRLVQLKATGQVYAKRPPQLVTCVESRWWRGETPLHVDSNIIAGGGGRHEYALSKNAGMHLEDATAALFDHLTERISLALDPSESAHVELAIAPRAVELYWEFSTADAMILVDLIISKLTALSLRSRVSGRRISPPTVETNRLSPSVSIDRTADNLLRIYAKTTDRIRVEVAFSRKAVSSEVPPSSPILLRQRVLHLAQVAANHVNWILPEIQINIPYPLQSKTADDLRGAISRAAPTLSVSMAILQSLIVTGGISAGNDDDTQEAIVALRRRGVLESVRPYSTQYRPTARYAEALEQIRCGL